MLTMRSNLEARGTTLKIPKIAAKLTGCTALVLVPFGCVPIGASNPAIAVSSQTLRSERERMRADPVKLERPVLILSGYRAMPSIANRLCYRIKGMTSQNEDDFLTISYTFGDDLHELAQRALREVQERWPSDDPDETIEVDVLAISMGGLVARHAALPPDQRPPTTQPPEADAAPAEASRRLKIHRLFTFGSPHRGAILAKSIAIDPAARAMKPSSDYIRQLNSTWQSVDYELIPYAHLHDGWVGATHSAPPGMNPFWDRGRLLLSHFSVSGNPLFLVDTARRLRGEDALLTETTEPPRD